MKLLCTSFIYLNRNFFLQRDIQRIKYLNQYHTNGFFRNTFTNESNYFGRKHGKHWKLWVGIGALTAGSVGVGAYWVGLKGSDSATLWPLKVGTCEAGEAGKDEIIPAIAKNKYPLSSNETFFIKNETKPSLLETIEKARDLVLRVKDEVGTPGIIIGVSVNGEVVWKEGFGYSNVENRIPCIPDTVMRIASISKPLTMTAVAKLWEEGKLDIDKPIQEYIPSFPEKNFNGDKVIITPRLLASHLSGIRHYAKKKNEVADSSKNKSDKNNNDKKGNVRSDSAYWEMYIKDKYNTVEEALKLFKDDPLLHKPGSQYLYTTYGFVLLSAVAEAAAKTPFPKMMKDLFTTLGLKKTYLDENEPLIYNRASYYQKKNNKLVNAPYVDNSYKWGGGGFLSTVGDLLQFGNAMLYSFQFIPSKHEKNQQENETVQFCDDKTLKLHENDLGKNSLKLSALPGFLKQETMKKLWSPVIQLRLGQDAKPTNIWYGMGWSILPAQQICEFCDNRQLYVSHSGGAIGASSILLIMPGKKWIDKQQQNLPNGIVVSIITNLTDVHLSSTAAQVAQLFEEVDL